MKGALLALLLASRLYGQTDPGTVEPVDFPKEMVKDVLRDQKRIWTSPFHANCDEAIEWLGFTALTTSLVLTDRRSSKIFENSAGQVSAGNSVSRIGAGYTVIPAAAGFYLYGAFAKNRKAEETGFLGGEALVDSLIVSEVLKLAAGRNRPNAPSKPGDFFQGGASFPSGHSMESWAVAAVVARQYGHHKWVPFVAYGAAGLVSSARYTARQHYASDVLAGGAIGFFIGRYVVNSHRAHAAIQPIAQPGTKTFGLQLSLN